MNKSDSRFIERAVLLFVAAIELLSTTLADTPRWWLALWPALWVPVWALWRYALRLVSMCAVVLLSAALLLAGCTSGDGSNNKTTTTTRAYYVDCGSAEQIGSGSCGLTVTSITGIGGGGQ